ncbi:hypothetical protein SDC9_195883 [bioreactor metagenome]|uniref:Uncharacterized protein n=1 Tax=bioreactor metagenome TaxID=1076179 RepID=A0A645IAC5_9ZZZZ
MQANLGLIHQTTLIVRDHLRCGFLVLHLLLVPGDQNLVSERSEHLHRRDPGTRGGTGRGLNRQRGDPGRFQHTFQTAVFK